MAHWEWPSVANISGNWDAFDSVDQLASVTGLAPSRVIQGESAGVCTDRDSSTAGFYEPVTSHIR